MPFSNAIAPIPPDNNAARETSGYLKILVSEIKKPWYRKSEGWFAFIAALGAIIGILFQISYRCYNDIIEDRTANPPRIRGETCVLKIPFFGAYSWSKTKVMKDGE